MSASKSQLALACALALATSFAIGSAVDGRAVKIAAKPSPEQVMAARDQRLLVLTSGIYDPTTERLLAPAALAQRSATAPSNRYIVQFEPAAMKDARANLEAMGARISGYLPHNAYLVSFEGGAAGLSRAPGVRFAGGWEAAHKLAPDVSARALAPNPGELVYVNVIGFEGESTDVLRQELASVVPPGSQLAAKDRAGLPRTLLQLPATSLQSVLPDVAGKGSVAWIELFEFPHTMNVDSVGPIQGNAGSAPSGGVPTFAPIWAQGLFGTGQIVAVADSGLDRNEGWFNRFWKDGVVNNEVTDAVNTFPPAPGPVFPNRKVYGYFSIPSPAPVVPGGTPYDNGASFHGTHVTGSVVGDAGTPATSALANYQNGEGMAPNAQVLFQDIGNDGGAGLTGDSDTPMWLQARNAGAFISSNSYGSDNSGAYNSSDAGVDRAAYLAQDLLINFAAGNDSPGPGQIGHPAHAKDALTVGALGHGNSVLAAGFSNLGPASDGRRKPDIHAPGSGIISAAGNDVDTNPPANPDQAITRSLSGTSMSTPTVSGGAALMRQYFYDGRYPTGLPTVANQRNLLGAEMKAVLLNGTAFIGTAPDSIYGWGRIWLDSNLFFPGDTRDLRLWGLRNESGLRTGDQHEYRVQVGAAAELRATLVWNDPPGTLGAGAALVNNLDLEVVDAGATLYRGNNFAGAGDLAISTIGGTADTLNNVEQVRLSLPGAGVYTIRVKGTAVPGMSIPGSNRQGYAVAVSTAAATTLVTTAPSDFTLANQAGGVLLTASAPVANAQAYQVYRADGSCASALARDFQFVGSTAQAGTTFTDTSTQGGYTYAYKLRGVDASGEGPISTCKEIVSTQPCTLTPTFNETSTNAARLGSTACGVKLSWTQGNSNCPSAPTLRYNVYRSLDPLFVPSPANKLVTLDSSGQYYDTSALSHTTYFYAVLAEDTTSGNPGPNGGNGTNAVARVKVTPYAPGSTPGSFSDGADSPSFIDLQSPWYLSNTRQSAGSFSYHNAVPGVATYSSNVCAAITSPPIVLQANAVLSYKARYDLEATWDGVVTEISTDGGSSWTPLPPTTPAGFPSSFSSTTATPINACGYPASQTAFSGTTSNAFQTFSTTLSALAGQTIRVRWRFSSDPGAEEEGFYLDEVSVTNGSTPAQCLNGEALLINSFE